MPKWLYATLAKIKNKIDKMALCQIDINKI